jgi:ABC-type Na+ efflux pump permease subunit
VEAIVPFALLSYVALLIGIPLGILGVFLHRVRILKHDWKPVLAKGIGAVAVWLFLSFVMMYVNFIFVYSGAHTPPEARGAVMPMLILLAITIGYGLAGWGLCYWVKGRATNSEELL